MTNQVQKQGNNNVQKSVEEQFIEKKPFIEDLINNVILSNYKPEFGYSEKELAEKKQNAHLFLIKLLGAKDTAKRPAILTASEDSIRECALTYLNGDYDLFKNQGYLFPYGNELKFMVSKDGYVALAKKLNPDIEDFYYDVVYKNDEFEYEKIAGKTIIVKHKQKLENITTKIEDIVCAYATCVFKDGTHIADIMTLQEIYNSLAVAQKSISDTHKKNPKIMLSKFPLRRLTKTRIYQSNPDIARVIIDDDVFVDEDNGKIKESINVSFSDEYSESQTKDTNSPIVEIIPEENPYEEFEDEENWTEEEIAEVMKEINNEEVPKVEVPKELETKSVFYSVWKNEFEKTGEWELVRYDEKTKKAEIRRKQKSKKDKE